MRRTVVRALLCVLLLGTSVACARAESGAERMRSAFALPALSAPPTWSGPGSTSAAGADGLIAQRAIEREWGASDDSLYQTVDVPGYKSEGFAMLASAAVPGSGQLYVGENSGWLFALAEVAGWTGRTFSNRKAERYGNQAIAYAGDPSDSSSNWSFARYRQATGGDPTALEQLYGGDREAFYRTIANDPNYLAGFASQHPEVVAAAYRDLRQLRDETLHRSWLIETALWLNHVVAAVDAFRAARSHNVPLRSQYELKLGQRWSHGQPEFKAALLRRF